MKDARAMFREEEFAGDMGQPIKNAELSTLQ